MRIKIPGFVLLALLALGAVDAGPQDEPPTFRSDAEVVVLDVVATDGKGRPVEGLSEDDVLVSENGTPCRILSFRLVGPAPATAPVSPDAAGPIAPGPTATAVRASLVVLVFDRLTTETAPLARQGALDLLSQSFPPDTWFAVFKVGYGVRMLAPFTTDTVLLHSAIEAATLGDVDKLQDRLASVLPLGGFEPELSGPVDPGNPSIPNLGPPIQDLGPVAEDTDGLAIQHTNDLGAGLFGVAQEGRVVARLTHDWPVEGPLNKMEGARLRSAVFRRELSLPPGRYVFEAAAQDRRTGARSTTRTSFEVPPAEGGLALSSVVLPRRAAPASEEDSPSDPLLIGEVSIPATSPASRSGRAGSVGSRGSRVSRSSSRRSSAQPSPGTARGARCR